MSKGIIKFFNEKKGWGFVTDNESQKELFVHFSNIKGDGFKTLHENDEVEYEIQDGAKGPQAVNVIKV